MADQRIPAITLGQISVPVLGDKMEIVKVSDTTDHVSGSSYWIALERLLGLSNHVVQGRLSLESGVAISTSDQSAKSHVYWVPYGGNLISIFDGTRWVMVAVASQFDLTLSSLTSGKNYDLFGYISAGAFKLDLGPQWNTGGGSDVARGTGAGSTELQLKDGVWTNKVSVTTSIAGDTVAANTGRLLGTLRTTNTTTTESSKAKRFLDNVYNQVGHIGFFQTTSSHTYNSATARYFNNSSANKLEVVCALPKVAHLEIGADLTPDVTAGQPHIFAALDWTSGGSYDYSNFINGTGVGARYLLNQNFVAVPVGYHYVAIIEAEEAAAVSTFAMGQVITNWQM